MEVHKELPSLTSAQFKEAVKKVAPHFAKYSSKHEYTCLDCGHVWKGKESDYTVCPHCGVKLKVHMDRWRTLKNKRYFAVIKRYKEFEVIRMFILFSELRKGKPAHNTYAEVFQRWISPNGKSTIVSLTRTLGGYYDQWNFCSDMEIRSEDAWSHGANPWAIIGKVMVTPGLKRNGFKGSLHGCNPNRVIPQLILNNKVETLWKCGYYDIVNWMVSSQYYNTDWWPAIKIAMRHHYKIADVTMWIDMLHAIHELGMDIHNPKNVCPQNLTEAHDYWIKRRDIHRAREREKREIENRKRQIQEVLKREENYKNEKSKFFSLEFIDGEIKVTPLTSIQEFIKEGEKMHHCVFSNRYYDKQDTLILHALVNGESIATIELNLATMEIVQCRGVCNSVPPHKERIINLINNNINQIINRCTA